MSVFRLCFLNGIIFSLACVASANEPSGSEIGGVPAPNQLLVQDNDNNAREYGMPEQEGGGFTQAFALGPDFFTNIPDLDSYNVGLSAMHSFRFQYVQPFYAVSLHKAFVDGGDVNPWLFGVKAGLDVSIMNLIQANAQHGFDPYFRLNLWYLIARAKVESVSNSESTLLIGAELGMRYFFTKYFATKIALSYDNPFSASFKKSVPGEPARKVSIDDPGDSEFLVKAGLMFYF